MIRIAHFSDAHLLCLEGIGFKDFLNKRWSGGLNLLLNRARHYKPQVFEALCDAVVELQDSLEQVVCTGDLVNLAVPSEFEFVQSVLTKRFPPRLLTVVRGNHDVYIAAAKGSLERALDAYFFDDFSNCRDQAPRVHLTDKAAIVGLDTAYPRPVFFADGRLGELQIESLCSYLKDPRVRDSLRILAMHHPPFCEATGAAKISAKTRMLRDTDAFIQAIRDLPESAKPHAILCGHDHVCSIHDIDGIPVLQVGMASHENKAVFGVYGFDEATHKLASVEWHHYTENGFEIEQVEL